MKRLIIGLAGRLASGKGRVGSILVERHQAHRIRSSDPLRATLDQYGVSQSRDNLSALSTFLRTTYGEETIASSMWKLITASPARIAIFDGMRRKVDVEYFRKFDNFYLIFMDTDVAIRYQRYITRNENPGDKNMTYEEFLKRDNLEPEQEIELLKEYADFVINNSGTLEHLDHEIARVLHTIMKE